MAKGNHAIKGSGGNYCCHCASSVGESVKVQPTNCDGEIWCPRCFVSVRMNQPDEAGCHDQPRFNASQAAACRCQFCAWVVVSFGCRPGEQLFCSNCLRPGALLLPMDDKYLTPATKEAIREAQEQMAKDVA